jgi:hypothetical protein
MDKELDREIKRLTRRIKKNDDLRKQCRTSASMLDIDTGHLESSTLRAAELRGTAAALESENDVLAYKLKLRSRLRERVRFMRQAADATWRACGGRGKTRELALALAKVTALQEECAELQNSHMEAITEGMRSQASTSELAQELANTQAILTRERRHRISKDEEIGRLRGENLELKGRVAALEDNTARGKQEIAALRENESVLRQSVSQQQVKTVKLEKSLATARVEADQSRNREARLRVHVATTSPRAFVHPGMLAGSLYGGGLGGSNIDALYGGMRSNIDGIYANPYLTDTARQLAFDSAGVLRDYEVRHLAETARLKKLDAELEVASAVERDVDSIRRARDRQNLALLRAEADLGITDSLVTSDL